jgi:hypothetical protein
VQCRILEYLPDILFPSRRFVSNVLCLTSIGSISNDQFPRQDFGIKGELPASWLSALVSSFLCLASSYLILETYPSTPLRVTESNAQSRNLKLGRLASWLLCLMSNVYILTSQFPMINFPRLDFGIKGELPRLGSRLPLLASSYLVVLSSYYFSNAPKFTLNDAPNMPSFSPYPEISCNG